MVIKKKTQLLILLSVLLLSVIYNIYNRHKVNLAMNNSVSIIALVTGIDPVRSASVIWVKFPLNNKIIESHFSVNVDTFKVGEKVLLKVAKDYPDKYVEIVKILNN